MSDPAAIDAFIARWENSGAAERANYQLFLSELCDLLDVPRPNPTSADPSQNRYVFERAVEMKKPDGSVTIGRIDCYFATRFVCETKQGVDAAQSAADPLLEKPAVRRTGHGTRGTAAFDRALERAFHQGRDYITWLPAAEGRPPFLMIIDVGFSIDLYAEFTGTGGHYERFPDPTNHRILLKDLHRPEIRDRLRLVWLDPHALDPSKIAAAVTRDIADRLARLANSLEADGHDPMLIARFLQRCLFTMFAEDMELLPKDGFRSLLDKLKDNPRGFPTLASSLWKEMSTGTSFSTLLFQEIACFNGGLFEESTALPLSDAQLAMLRDAAATDWANVEPSIFGTLLTRALDARERHKLGAEYTPRAYVERLVRPVIIDPLRREWEDIRAAAATLHQQAEALLDQAADHDQSAKDKLASGQTAAAKDTGALAHKARAEAKKKDLHALDLVTDFHRRLCQLKVLDPACGTANFLYVTLEHLKRLEAEVLELLEALGGNPALEMQGSKVRPEQFLGLEMNHQAVAIAQLVLWIGYFQWQKKTTGKADTGDRPLLPKQQSIVQQDAVLAHDAMTPRRDPQTGEVITVWDGHTTKTHPVTGKEVPDESARRTVFDYANPRPAEWPQADFIVGNPPFIGASRMREALGDGYTEALRLAWKGKVPESADFVMFWWHKAAETVAQSKARRFGFITTNSIHQTFNRRVLESFLTSNPVDGLSAQNDPATGRDGSPSRPDNEQQGHRSKAGRKRLSSDSASASQPHGPLGQRSLPIHLAYAIPDHPWIDSADGAAVRIAMTVGAPGKGEGILEIVTAEESGKDGEVAVTLQSARGTIAANLQVGADVASCLTLQANSNLANHGVIRGGEGFLISPDQLEKLGYGRREGIANHLRPILNGSDLTSTSRSNYVIDLFGLSESHVQDQFPEIYQWIYTHVRPARLNNKRATRRENWWLFNESVPKLRNMLAGLPRFISTSETAKHRIFVFVDASVLPEHKLVNIAHAEAGILAIISSCIHIIWALACGSRLEDRPVYVKSTCFETFPFPSLPDGPLKSRLRDLGERLDAHRKSRQAAHPDLTLTGMYNVLEKLRTGEPLSAKDKTIHDQGLVTLLKQIHDEIDRAVLEAYGWLDLLESNGPKTQDGKTQDARSENAAANVLDCGGNPDSVGGDTALADDAPPPKAPSMPAHSNTGTAQAQHEPTSPAAPASLHPSSARLSSPNALNPHPFSLADRLARPGPDADTLSQSLLSRLVALNHERAAEEKSGHIRWLRPDYQAPLRNPADEVGAPQASGSALQPSSFTLQSSLNLATPAPSPSDSSFIGSAELAERPQPSSFAPTPWPADLPSQVLAIRNLLPVHGPDPAALSAVFGRKSTKREAQIASILATLEALGKA